MRIQANLLLLLTISTCSLLLVFSVYPGVLNHLLLSVAIALLWLILLTWVAIVGIILWVKRGEASIQPTFQRLTATVLILVISYGLMKFYIPRRIAFSLSRSTFETWLVIHPNPTSQPQSLETKLGFYNVQDYFLGSQSDAYFRTYSHGDGLGPDTVSYGFARQPNRERSPFGAAHYSLHSLGHDWYWFKASNDW